FRPRLEPGTEVSRRRGRTGCGSPGKGRTARRCGLLAPLQCKRKPAKAGPAKVATGFARGRGLNVTVPERYRSRVYPRPAPIGAKSHGVDLGPADPKPLSLRGLAA